MADTLPLHLMLDVESISEETSRDLHQILKEVGANALLFLLTFGMNGTVDMRNLKKQLHNRKAIHYLKVYGRHFVLLPPSQEPHALCSCCLWFQLRGRKPCT